MTRLIGSTVLAAVILAAGPTAPTAQAGEQDEIRILREQVQKLQKRLDELEQKQAETEQEVEETKENALIATGSSPGRYRIPGTETEFEISGYVKGDFIFDTQEGAGDFFVTENITTSEQGDEQRFRAHARQSRVRIKTFTPTEWGELTTHIEGDFFGGGGNQAFSNSTPFRLRHATATIGGVRIGQYWTNFMPIASYPWTVDFQGPAGIPFIRQAQIRYTHQVNENLSISGSLENSEFNGRNAAGAFGEAGLGQNLGINAGIDKAPDVTAAATYKDDWGMVKVAALGRYLGSPNGNGDGEFGWGINLSGNATPWPGGVIRAQFTYGDGVGRYIINGFGQDAFVRANGDVDTIEAYGVTAQVGQQVTEDLLALVAFGRYEAMDSFAPGDLDNTNSLHATLFWTPIDRLTIGGEVIWGNREDANGASDSNVRLQASVQVNF